MHQNDPFAFLENSTTQALLGTASAATAGPGFLSEALALAPSAPQLIGESLRKLSIGNTLTDSFDAAQKQFQIQQQLSQRPPPSQPITQLSVTDIQDIIKEERGTPAGADPVRRRNLLEIAERIAEDRRTRATTTTDVDEEEDSSFFSRLFGGLPFNQVGRVLADPNSVLPPN